MTANDPTFYYSIYVNICVLCNPDVGEENKEFKPPNHPPSVYIGETARSLYERGKEHWEGFKTKSENYHIFKHHQIHHDGRGEPEFLLRPIKFFRTALSRQIAEAAKIGRLGEEVVLNSKSEYNRCKIGRLTLGDEYLENREQCENKEIGRHGNCGGS